MSTITVIGRLTADPELNFTPSGRKVANFTIAENRRVRDDQGNWSDGEPTFWGCAIWGPVAEHLVESAEQGTQVMVLGATRTRTWEITKGERQGQTARVTEIVADHVGIDLQWGTAKFSKAERTDRAPITDEAGYGEEPPM